MYAVKRLLIGLGNPGEKYMKTRHNIGFQAIDYFHKYYLKELIKNENKLIYEDLYDGKFLRTFVEFKQEIDNKNINKYDLIDQVSERRRNKTKEKGVIYPLVDLMIYKPNSFINLCGHNIRNVIDQEHLKLKKNPVSLNKMDEILVVHDDISLPLGTVKFSHQAGSSNHNGIKSIDSRLIKNQKYSRIRIGANKEGARPIDYVLQDLNVIEQDVLLSVYKFVSEVIRVYLFRGVDDAEYVCNSRKNINENK